ncbi:hypothetical protein QJQ45_020541, partial [Haematococcus lacustris]
EPTSLSLPTPSQPTPPSPPSQSTTVRRQLRVVAKYLKSKTLVACQSADCAWLQVIKVTGGAVLRGCKKTKRKLKAHLYLVNHRSDEPTSLSLPTPSQPTPPSPPSQSTTVRRQLRVVAKYLKSKTLGPSTPPSKQRKERRAEWKTRRRQVIKVTGGAVLRGCKKTKRKLKAHFQLQAEIYSQLRPAAMDMDWDPEAEAEPEPEPEREPAPAPPTLGPPSARLAARHPPPAARIGPPMPLASEDPVMLQKLQVFCEYFANSNKLTPWQQQAPPTPTAAQWQPQVQQQPADGRPAAPVEADQGPGQAWQWHQQCRRDTERWLAPIKPHHQHLAAGSSAGTSLEANLKHITVTLATWDAVWQVYLGPKWAQQRLRLYGAQDWTLEQFFQKLEEDMAEVSMERHGHAKQLVVFFGAAGIGTRGGPGAQTSGGVLVDEHRTSRVSSAVNGQQPCERQLNKRRATRPAGWKPPAGQVHHRLVRPAWSQQRDQPVRGMMWCPVVAPRKPPQAPRSSREAPQPAASEPGPSTPLPAKRSKRTKAEPAAEPNKAQGKAVKAKPAPQLGRWLDRDCNAALNMQRVGESKWRPLELCWWPEQGKLPAKGKEYPGLGYKRLQPPPLPPGPPTTGTSAQDQGSPRDPRPMFPLLLWPLA